MSLNFRLILGGVFVLGVLFTGACENQSVNFYSGQCSDIPEVYSDLPGMLICGTETWENDTTVTGPHFVLPGSRLKINAGVTVEFTYHRDIPAKLGAIIALPVDDKRFGRPYPSARLIAEGTEDQPIVFTSARPKPTPGDWTGLLILGRAFTGISNSGVGKIEGLQNITYGGDHNLDNSGSLEYVRIEYSGSGITGAGPSAGLSLYAAGRSTKLNYIQVYRSGSDGVNIYGGKSDLKNIIVYGAPDDSFVLKHGWQGRGQFWVAVQEAGAGFGIKSTGCNILADCPTNGRPAISNVILYGAGKSEKENTGMFLKKNMQGSYHNFIISNFAGYHWRLQGQNGGAGTSDDKDMTFENYGSRLKFNNFLLHNNGGWENASLTQHYKSSYTMISAEKSIVLFNDVEHFDFSLPDASPYLTGGQFPGDSWFEQVEFHGAMGPSEWPWARWPK